MSMTGLAICPSADKDLFRLRVDVGGKNLRATVTTDISAGQLALRVLNGNGAALGSGLPIDSTHIDVVINNLAVGYYFVEISAPTDFENNYALEIFTCDAAGCPGATCQ
jgi:hypothetical protein